MFQRFILLMLACISIRKISAKSDKIVCYLSTGGLGKQGKGHFKMSNIDPFLCTHLNYAFATINDNGTFELMDEHIALKLNALRDFEALKNTNPSLKTLMSVGGWGDNSTKYSDVVTDSVKRQNFLNTSLEFLLKYNLDGLDLDWEYPTWRGGRETDKENFVTLLKEVREVFRKHDLLLTAAVGAQTKIADSAYDIPQLSRYLDLINIMTYDLHIPENNVTGFNSPLFPDPKNPDDDNIDKLITYWLSKGADPSKITVGVPFYGHSFKLTDTNRTEAGSPSDGPGMAAGNLGFNEICEILNNADESNWTAVYYYPQKVPYMYRENDWISYDDTDSIYLKAKYAKQSGLAGITIWSIDMDDFLGNCYGQRFPLLHTINKVLYGNKSRTN